MSISWIDFFLDPILRAPMWASMLMGLSTALIGVLAFVRRRSLIGEALAHASYPGVVLGVIVGGLFNGSSEASLEIAVLVGAFFSALLGFICIDLLQRFCCLSGDTALCFVLAIFFGVGSLIASHIQLVHPVIYQQAQLCLLGQAATMTDGHVILYGSLTVLILFLIYLLYRPFQLLCFDQDFGKSVGLRVKILSSLISFLYALSIVIGLASVGVVLMSGMLIAPAAAARQWTQRLSHLFILAGVIGMISGFCGNYFSLMIPFWIGEGTFSLPTGPMILLSAFAICFVSFFFAFQKGIVWRLFRIIRFRERCLQENVLKWFWKKSNADPAPLKEMLTSFAVPSFFIYLELFRLRRQGWLKKWGEDRFVLTADGKRRADQIVRLHRLWEVYLVDYLGQNADRVHRNAEEMEHILTPELEKELTELLNHPQKDPHQQPIPKSLRMAFFSSTHEISKEHL